MPEVYRRALVGIISTALWSRKLKQKCCADANASCTCPTPGLPIKHFKCRYHIPKFQVIPPVEDDHTYAEVKPL